MCVCVPFSFMKTYNSMERPQAVKHHFVLLCIIRNEYALKHVVGGRCANGTPGEAQYR